MESVIQSLSCIIKLTILATELKPVKILCYLANDLTRVIIITIYFSSKLRPVILWLYTVNHCPLVVACGVPSTGAMAMV